MTRNIIIHTALLTTLTTAASACVEHDTIDTDGSLGELRSAESAALQPAHYWPGDGTTEDAVAHVDASLMGNATYTTGRFGGGFGLGGDHDWLNISSAAAVLGTGAFTVSAWINTTDDLGVIIQQRSSSAYDGQWVLRVAAGKLCYWDWSASEGGAGLSLCSTSAVNDGQWHHVAFVRDALGTGQLYIDAVLAATQAGVTPRELRAIDLSIGADRRDFERFVPGLSYIGAIDEVKIYDTALSAAQLGQDMAGPSVDSDGDGVPDDSDRCAGYDDSLDADADNVPDACDMCLGNDSSGDTDQDGRCDDLDNCPINANANQDDADLDGIGDVCEADSDEDGTIDDLDNCPADANPDQADSDLDGVGEVCDDDDDDDGVADELDDCPLFHDPAQVDTDGDGQGDACDGDDDGDGYADEQDACSGTPLDVLVGAQGCSGEQSVAATCVDHDVCMFKNAGEYQKCIVHASNAARAAGLLSNEQRAALVKTAAALSCSL